MRNLIQKLWNDDAGIVATEYLFLGTIVGLGLVIGFAAVESALNSELVELANAITSLDQSYGYSSQSSCKGFKTGSEALDEPDSAGFGFYAPVSQDIFVDVCP